METWKPVLGFEGLYEVSDYGNVRRIARAKTLDAAKIPKAKAMIEHGATLKEIAVFLNTSITTAYSIKQGKTWNGDASYRLIKPRIDSKHYEFVSLTRNGKATQKRLHRMVWEAFYGPIPNRMEINHKDLNRSNNSVNNLEILTHQENIQHAIDLYASRGMFRAVKGIKGFIEGRHSDYDNQ